VLPHCNRPSAFLVTVLTPRGQFSGYASHPTSGDTCENGRSSLIFHNSGRRLRAPRWPGAESVAGLPRDLAAGGGLVRWLTERVIRFVQFDGRQPSRARGFMPIEVWFSLRLDVGAALHALMYDADRCCVTGRMFSVGGGRGRPVLARGLGSACELKPSMASRRE